MIQTVLKRDGRVVGFNEEKIATAISGKPCCIQIKVKTCN